MTEVKMSAKDLHLWYGEMEALKGVSLDMNKNSVTALIGPSGCGKSTFLKTLNRMNDLVEGCRIEGDVRLDGEDIFRKISSPSRRTSPSIRQPSTKSFMRLRVLRNVDLPQPEGPISAVTLFLFMSRETPLRASISPYQRCRSLALIFTSVMLNFLLSACGIGAWR